VDEKEATVRVRAIRGATQLEQDSREHMLERVAEMVTGVLGANELAVDDFISIVFTATADLTSEFPAYAARLLGFDDVPLICARELEVEGSMPRVVRMLAHVETHLSRAEVTHVYLHGAAQLRRDLSRVREVPDSPAAPGEQQPSAGSAGSAGSA
jgi:chorismate mutase